MAEPKASRGGALHPLAELTRVRMLEFLREPEAVFWVFVFPVLLALALGIAFRDSGATSYRVGVTDPAIADRLAGAPTLSVAAMERSAALEALGRGRLDIVVEVEPGSEPLPRLVYRFDQTRPRDAPPGSRSTTRCSAPTDDSSRCSTETSGPPTAARATSTS